MSSPPKDGTDASGPKGTDVSGSAPAVEQVRPRSVTPTSLDELLALPLPGLAPLTLWRAGSPDTALTGVTLREEDVLPGDLFAALPGSRTHGGRFIPGAIARGAVAILTDDAGLEFVPAEASELAVLVHPDARAVLGYLAAHIYGNPSRSLKLIGITGTSGKTTTSYMVEAALLAAGKSAALIGTVETRINGVQSPSTLTTPEAPQLQALLATMLEQGVDTVVMEVSSHALVLGRAAGSHFAVGAFTNLSQDHLDFHKDFEDYFAAKARLFATDSPVHAAKAVVCVDDEWGRRMATIAGHRLAAAVSTDPTFVPADSRQAVWRANDSVVHDDGSQRFSASLPDGRELSVSLPIPGKFNEANALLALAVLTEVGLPAEDAIRGLAHVNVPGRLEQVNRGQPFLAVVDYAHKPAALEAVIATLRAQSGGRLAVVFGAGGDRDASKRPLMGKAAASGADLVVVTDDNPRSENPERIRAQVLEGTRIPNAAYENAEASVIEIADRSEAITYAVRWAKPGDIVLVAGKGHETGQEIDGVKHAFDDRLVLTAAIEEL